MKEKKERILWLRMAGNGQAGRLAGCGKTRQCEALQNTMHRRNVLRRTIMRCIIDDYIVSIGMVLERLVGSELHVWHENERSRWPLESMGPDQGTGALGVLDTLDAQHTTNPTQLVHNGRPFSANNIIDTVHCSRSPSIRYNAIQSSLAKTYDQRRFYRNYCTQLQYQTLSFVVVVVVIVARIKRP